MSRIKIIAEQLRTYNIHIYLLFAIYSVTVAPYISGFMNFGERNYLVALFGLPMYVAEFFAFKFKLKMIRMNVELKRAEIEKMTGASIETPRIGYVLWYALFMRMIIRVGFVVVSFMALGHDAGIIVFALFAEVLLLMYVVGYADSGLFRDYPFNKVEVREQKEQDEKWREGNMKYADSESYKRKEFFADIILYLFAFMVYTAFWGYINEEGMRMVAIAHRQEESAIGFGINLFMMLGAMASIGMMPMRLAYWIEESVMSFEKKEKMKLRFYFIMAVLFTFTPSIAEYIRLFFRT
jgi:hypothetical protein